MKLTDLSNEDLLSQLDSLVCAGRRLCARLIAYLIEVEQRRLHLDSACSSLFDFCVRRLGMSEGEAFRRITAARLAKRFPGLLGRIERGEVHLSALVLLRDHLDDRNHEELLDAAKRKSKREVQAIIAARFPRPDAPSLIRKLPSSSVAASPQAGEALLLGGTPSGGSPSGPASGGEGRPPTALPSAPPSSSSAGVEAEAIDATPRTDAHRLATASRDASEAGPTAATSGAALQGSSRDASEAGPTAATSGAASRGAPPRQVTEAPSRARIEPLSAERYKVQLTASAELREKIERATALMRHRNPSGDLAVVVERAMDLLIAELEKERLGKVRRPREQAAGDAQDAGASPRSTRPGYVSRAVRRQVFDRDGERCSFVDEEGRRCPAREYLELDHIVPRALGGSDDAGNLRVACRMHNRRAAERAFGRELVEERIRSRQRKQQAPPVARSGGGVVSSASTWSSAPAAPD